VTSASATFYIYQHRSRHRRRCVQNVSQYICNVCRISLVNIDQVYSGMTETSSSPMTRRDTMIRHSSSARSNVVPLSVDKPVARATANIEWSVYAVCPEGFTARGWLCISGTIVPLAPQIHITRVVVSQCPSVRPSESLSLSLSPPLSPSLLPSFLSRSRSRSHSRSLHVRSFGCVTIRLRIEIAREYALSLSLSLSLAFPMPPADAFYMQTTA
jgi:hypothetical protein